MLLVFFWGGVAASLGLESAYLHVGLPLSEVIKSLHQVEARLHRLSFRPLLYHNLRSCPIFRSFYTTNMATGLSDIKHTANTETMSFSDTCVPATGMIN